MLETLVLSFLIATLGVIATANYYKFGRKFSEWRILPFLTNRNDHINDQFRRGSNPIYHLDSHSKSSPCLSPFSDKDEKEEETSEPEMSELDRKISEYQEANNTKVIFLIHNAPASSLLGIDFGGLIGEAICPLNTTDVIRLLDIIREIPEDANIDLILHTKGGLMSSAEVIVKTLLNHMGRVRIHIPYHAESAGTLIALTGHRIFYGKSAWITQVDPQMSYWSASTMLDFTEKVCPQVPNGRFQNTFIQDIARLVAIPAQKAMDRAIELTRRICESRKYDSINTEEVLTQLVRGTSNHDKPLLIEDQTDLLKNISPITPEVLELYRLRIEEKQSKKKGMSMF